MTWNRAKELRETLHPCYRPFIANSFNLLSLQCHKCPRYRAIKAFHLLYNLSRTRSDNRLSFTSCKVTGALCFKHSKVIFNSRHHCPTCLAMAPGCLTQAHLLSSPHNRYRILCNLTWSHCDNWNVRITRREEYEKSWAYFFSICRSIVCKGIQISDITDHWSDHILQYTANANINLAFISYFVLHIWTVTTVHKTLPGP
jgi:hypothetical protein